MGKGYFIVFEGIDGCGKTTQLLLLAKYIINKDKYASVCITREPYKSREVRKILKRNENPYKEAEKLAKLFVKDRKEHIREVILPSLKKGINVLCDRYKLSTLVYQSTQGIQIQKLINMHKNMPVPDITFIIDLPADLARKRMKKEGRKMEQKFEKSIEFQELLRKAYLKMPKILRNEKIFIIDGTKNPEEVFDAIKEIYDREIG